MTVTDWRLLALGCSCGLPGTLAREIVRNPVQAVEGGNNLDGDFFCPLHRFFCALFIAAFVGADSLAAEGMDAYMWVPWKVALG